ncbi:aminoacylase [Pseudomaricurvus alkylphenolicus]|uniref:amidohydrolase family protein n=1 Tax=Pseudomaricurvus alkylphenolicus TaxID=1306991 RepID=UPI0014221C2A|nr:amidohydrolase family protein [Pseudomaricurvus alkylphenolicus]NIB38443.1 aminoacylase [Pseudomaricurvus alkylphenolicus]
MVRIIWIILFTYFAVVASRAVDATEALVYDIAIIGGRVMDPETKFDAVRNVGILDGRIAAITSDPIGAQEVIDAVGMVVAPGFIDTQFHGQDVFASKMALRDGVTTGLDLEGGAINVGSWYKKKEGRWQINFGVAASYPFARMAVHDTEVSFQVAVDFGSGGSHIAKAAADGLSGWSESRSNTHQINQISALIDEDLRQGAIGVGIPLAYMARAASSYEVFEVQRTAARYGRPASVHTRFHLDSKPPTESAIGFDEVFTNAALLGAPLLIAHNNDYGWEEIEEKLQLARLRGMNMWSEYYPYDAGSTAVSAAFLQPAVWEEKYGYKYEDTLYDPKTDRLLDKRSYQSLVEEDPSRTVVVFLPPRRQWLPYWLTMPHMTVASDGMPGVGGNGKLLPWNAEYTDYVGHPRSAGTRAKVLRMGREYGVPLMHTLAQLSYWSAKHLGDAGLLSMKDRGRMQVNKVADIVVFDPDKVTDHAGFKAGTTGLPSTGIPWVIVNGMVVVNNSRVLSHVTPGTAIRYPVEEQGRFTSLSAEQWVREFTILPGRFDEKVDFSHLPD